MSYDRPEGALKLLEASWPLGRAHRALEGQRLGVLEQYVLRDARHATLWHMTPGKVAVFQRG